MSNQTKILSALSGINPYLPKKTDDQAIFHNVSTRNYDPPAYIVAFLFLAVLRFRNFGAMEKVWWHTYFEYRGFVFLLRDYKFGTWSLEMKGGVKAPEDLVKQVIEKIRSASRHADAILRMQLEKEIQKGEFWIHNGYSSLRDVYDHYHFEVKKQLKAQQRHGDQKAKGMQNPKTIMKYLNKEAMLDRLLAYRTFPLMVSFYSLLEFLLDGFYAFEQPPLTFIEFRKLGWKARFKAVIPPSAGSDVVKIYEKLIQFKNLFRNPLTHGLTNQSALLVPVPFAGLVPVTYEHLSSSVHFGVSQIPPDKVVEIAATFKAFLKFASGEKPYAYYMSYLERGFSVPVAKRSIAEIRAEMKGIKKFNAYLEGFSRYQDDLTNRDI